MFVCVCVSSRKLSGGDDENKSGGAKKKDSSAEFNPSKGKYHPVDDACWKRGEK